MTDAGRTRLSPWRGMFYLLLALGIVLSYLRFSQGLGAVTNLSDRYPWGLWVGFDLLCGVGLAAGGFVITAAVYVLNLERLRPIVRPAILTAFLGYLLVTIALIYDIGRPWNIWHPIIHWNPHSVMFEVAWCVTLYSTVLALEFSGMVFEKIKWHRAARVQHAITFPLVVLGVVLSTLHQSSLGTVYLIVPGKLHQLWYTPILPIVFFVSAVTVGLAMVIVESRLSARAFGRKLEMPLLSEIARALVGVLGVYAVIRFFDLAARGALPALFALDYESLLALLEIGPFLLLPLALLAFPKVRHSPRALYASALLVVLGFVTHRLNVSITGFEGAQGGHYVPAWTEVAISLFMVALGFGAFALAVRYLDIYPEEEAEDHAGAHAPKERAAVREPAVVLR